MIGHEKDRQSVPMVGDGVIGVTKRIVLGPEDGYDGFFRIFTIQEGGKTPYHTHPWFHANYILEGKGILAIEGQETKVEQGSVAYIEGGKRHNFSNPGPGLLRFICLVPSEGDSY